MYKNNPTAINDGLDDDEDETTMEEEEFEEVELTKVLDEYINPLYEGSWTSRLIAVLLFLNWFTIFGVSNARVDDSYYSNLIDWSLI